MIKKKNQRRLAVLCSIALSFGMLLEYKVPLMTAYGYTVKSATVQASVLNVRSGPGTTNAIVSKLGKGTAVSVIGEASASDGALWYEIRFTDANGQTVTGYVSKSYLKFPIAYHTDQNFEARLTEQGFPESYKDGLRQLHAQYPNWVFKAQHTNLDWNEVIRNQSVIGRNLVHKNSVSSWKSTESGAYNWDSSTWSVFDSGGWVAASDGIIRHYMDPRNFFDETYVFQFLIHTNNGNYSKEGLQHIVSGTFLSGTTTADQSQASESSSTQNSESSQQPGNQENSGSGSSSSSGGVIGPGANLGNPSGNGSAGGQPSGNASDNSSPDQNNGQVTLEAPGAQASLSRKQRYMLMSSVETGIGPGVGSSGSVSPPVQPSGSTSVSISGASGYIDMIMNASQQTGVNPYVLAAMIIQEQGRQGTSGSVSGNSQGYSGYYNFFNIEAYQSGSMTAVQRGLWYASQSGSYLRPWNSREKSILGGAMFYAQNYVNAGQDTFYLKKFNVQGSNLYKHQYMTNVQGGASEAALYAQAYNEQLRNTALEFKIPVFLNMPETAAPLPMLDGSPNNKLSALSVNGYSLTPTFSRDTTVYDVMIGADVTQLSISATTLDSGASLQGGGTVNLSQGNQQLTLVVTARNGTIRNYTINVVRQGSSGSSSGGNPPVSEGSSSSGSSSGTVGPGGNSSGGTGSTGSSGTPGGSNVTIIN